MRSRDTQSRISFPVSPTVMLLVGLLLLLFGTRHFLRDSLWNNSVAIQTVKLFSTEIRTGVNLIDPLIPCDRLLHGLEVGRIETIVGSDAPSVFRKVLILAWRVRYALASCNVRVFAEGALTSKNSVLRTDIKVLLGTIHWRLGNSKTAWSLWQNTGFAHYLSRRAVYFFEQGSMETARRYAEMALALNPEDVKSLIVYGVAGARTGMRQESVINALMKASRLDPTDWYTSLALSDVYLYFDESNNYKMALDQLEEARRRGMPPEKYHFQRGYILYLMKEYERALLEFSTADQLTTTADEKLLWMEGLTLTKLERFEEAIEVFKKLARQFPHVLQYRLELARAYLALGNKAAATNHCRIALESCNHCTLDSRLLEDLGNIEACNP